ncbi:hypothetical protein [Halobellus ordinarius]|uniref:hypothetical protein n=1 Tax=Halobellus ordinarius TaxID=3075120 RepID=UPI00288016F5|nr:hypothetical protein [Halobellus sp. ZY16]
MSVARSFRALELYDVLANLVPGAVVLLALSAIFRVETYLQFSTGAIATGTFLVAALVCGHIIQLIASALDGTPTLFGDVIQATRDGNTDELPIAVTHVEEAIWPLMQRKFSLPDDFDDYGTLFRLLLSYIETTPATRALRFQALHSFHRSMWAVGYVAAVLTLSSMLLKCTGWIAVRSWPVLGLVLTGSLAGIWVFKRRKTKMNNRFIQYAIADFYSDQVQELNSGVERGS